jgi:hypothetical protein
MAASGRGGNKIKRGWAVQLPNSLEARSRASETEPDRLGTAPSRQWATQQSAPLAERRVFDSSQARSEPTAVVSVAHQHGAGVEWAEGSVVLCRRHRRSIVLGA